MSEKLILDATCGSRSIWFQKEEPHTIYCDIREGEFDTWAGLKLTKAGEHCRRHIQVKPDMLVSFDNMPFPDNSFNLVVWDPPHIADLSKTAWFRNMYGSLDGNWKPMIAAGFKECMRVLKPGGVLIFKWSEISISTRTILNVIGQEPLFGHRSGKKMNTHWMCFMKFEE